MTIDGGTGGGGGVHTKKQQNWNTVQDGAAGPSRPIHTIMAEPPRIDTNFHQLSIASIEPDDDDDDE